MSVGPCIIYISFFACFEFLIVLYWHYKKANTIRVFVIRHFGSFYTGGICHARSQAQYVHLHRRVRQLQQGVGAALHDAALCDEADGRTGGAPPDQAH